MSVNFLENLISPRFAGWTKPPTTDFSCSLHAALELLAFKPDLLRLIGTDLQKAALSKKTTRLEDRHAAHRQDPMLPGSDMVPCLPFDKPQSLDIGRTGMDPETCFVFVVIRGYFGGVKSKIARDFFGESMTLHLYLANRSIEMPSHSTILENTNKISQTTLDAIFDAQIGWVKAQGLDDFNNITSDSTACQANSCWPTDSSSILSLAWRLWRASLKMTKFGYTNQVPGEIPEILEELHAIDFQIALARSKKKAVEIRKEGYIKFQTLAENASQTFCAAIVDFRKETSTTQYLPSMKAKRDKHIATMTKDLEAMCQLIANAIKRVIDAEKVPYKDRIASVSDPDASFISKGQRDTVIGYHPQLSKSANGFVTGLIVPEGNASDSGQVMPLFKQTVARTGVIAGVWSFDDGYTSLKNQMDLKAEGVAIVSFSGAKGKKITLVEDWESEAYRQARRMRSAVESVVFQVKRCVNFGQICRRTIEKVRAELTWKILAFNFYRIQYLLR